MRKKRGGDSVDGTRRLKRRYGVEDKRKGKRGEGKAFAKPRPEEKVESVHFRAPTGLRTVEGFA